uniref:SLIT and NTRK-like family, member 3a n=1 Tax=Eptatretus burgeri TaxID=7764 RepID=A0A8C4Q3J7_EPTBU
VFLWYYTVSNSLQFPPKKKFNPASPLTFCPSPCHCESSTSLVLLHCDGRALLHVDMIITPKPTRPYALYLYGNSISSLRPGELLSHAAAVSLDLSNNGLVDISPGAFSGLSSLRRLVLLGNKMEALLNYTFLGLPRLEYLQADYNLVKEIEAGVFRPLPKLRVLLLNDNLIRYLPAGLFFGLTSLRHLDLRANHLRHLPTPSLLSPIAFPHAQIRLDDNPWNCACSLVPLRTWLTRSSSLALLGDVLCDSPFDLHGKSLADVSEQILCGFKGEDDANNDDVKNVTSDSSLQTQKAGKTELRLAMARAAGLGFNPEYVIKPPSRYRGKSPLPTSCPSTCTCHLHPAHLGLSVQCQGRGISHISKLRPRPLNPQRLDLSMNTVTQLSRFDFRDLSSLIRLNLGSNHIRVIKSGAFSLLSYLQSLHLNNNYLERLSASSLQGLSSLLSLYLEHNSLHFIEPRAFASSPSLQLLFLQNNRLEYLEPGALEGITPRRLGLRGNLLFGLPRSGVLDSLHAIIQVGLDSNPWKCNCTAMPFREWALTLSTGTLQGIPRCASPAMLHGRSIFSLLPSELCPHDNSPANACTESTSTEPLAIMARTSPKLLNLPISVFLLIVLALFLTGIFVAAALAASCARAKKPSCGMALTPTYPHHAEGENCLAGKDERPSLLPGDSRERAFHRMLGTKSFGPVIICTTMIESTLTLEFMLENASCAMVILKKKKKTLAATKIDQYSASQMVCHEPASHFHLVGKEDQLSQYDHFIEIRAPLQNSAALKQCTGRVRKAFGLKRKKYKV